MTAVGNADLHRAVYTYWDAVGIDWEFKKLWTSTERDNFAALNEGTGAPGQPFPHCVFSQSPGVVRARMSGSGAESRKRQIQDVPWDFRVWARPVDGDPQDRTGKELAADLVDLIIQKFGGHPTVDPPGRPELTHGGFLIAQYQTDYSVRDPDADTTWLWVVSYMFKVDQPIRAG